MDFLRMRTDPAPLMVLLLLPILMMTAITPLTRALLRSNGFPHATGAEQSVPGMAIMFSFMPIMLLGASFFREHDWHTWERLRASPARAFEIVIGKALPIYTFSITQLAVVWLIGAFLFGLQTNGPDAFLATGMITASLAFATVGVGVALVSVCRTVDQLGITANFASLILGGLSGAFMPLNLQPAWVGKVALVAPQYWAMSAYREVILNGRGLPGVAPNCVIVLAFGVLGFCIAALKFRMADAKVGKT
jgi:ABC-2 type transport system permease protein